LSRRNRDQYPKRGCSARSSHIERLRRDPPMPIKVAGKFILVEQRLTSFSRAGN
jgi:hypothetical protein